MSVSTYKPQISKKNCNSIDLAGHHALCEINYHRMLMLVPGLLETRNSEDSVQVENLRWQLAISYPQSSWAMSVSIAVQENAPYTTTVEIAQSVTPDNILERPPKLVVRLYHDVRMAEIVSWDNHRHWQPRYKYPNPQMYLPDEKLSLNSFLGDWLKFCCNRGVLKV